MSWCGSLYSYTESKCRLCSLQCLLKRWVFGFCLKKAWTNKCLEDGFPSVLTAGYDMLGAQRDHDAEQCLINALM